MNRCQFPAGIILMLAGLGCVLAALTRSGNDLAYVAGVAVVLLGGGATLAFGINPFPKLTAGPITVGEAPSRPNELPLKKLEEETRNKREEYARRNPPPANDARAFNALTDTPDLSSVPTADPMVPMYLLDKNFRILDWNDAFTLAFDHTMEGRRGQGALEWVYFLDNFKEVLDHGRKVFSDPASLPEFDREELRYTSLVYGELVATKRAYRFPDDSGAYAGWLVLLDLTFADAQRAERYQFDLTQRLWRSLVWSEYALAYDKVLKNSQVYQELLSKMVGEKGHLEPIADEARVLDLGAGTGNVTMRLAKCGRLVFALDNNRVMLNVLRAKLRAHGVPLRRDDAGPGVVILTQDANSLFGLADDYFDCVVANNVLYNLDNPEACLEEIVRVLRPGGQLRLSGPNKGVNLSKVFRRIKSDLTVAGVFSEVEYHYEQARKINYLLEPALKRWAARDAPGLLAHAGFQDIDGEETYYEGNGRIFFARKPFG
jgi:ubiquinone/menaquinone biosynthesis C-methylase UbiE